MSPVPFEASASRLDDGIRVISVRGELDLGTAAEFEPSLDEAVAGGDDPLLVDLTECEFIDSTGIALIVRAWQRLGQAGDDGPGRVAVCTGNDQVRRVLEITGLEVSIPLHDSRDEALAALRSG